MPSPICVVNGGSTANGANVSPSTTTTIALASKTGVDVWQITCIGTDETTSSATITSSLTVDYVNKSATFTSPTSGKAMVFRSVVNGGIQDGVRNASLITTFEIFTLSGGLRVMAVNEALEGNGTFGWVTTINAMIRAH